MPSFVVEFHVCVLIIMLCVGFSLVLPSLHFLLSWQEGMAPINLLIETEMHRATPGGTGGVKTIGNYAAVS